MTLTKPTAEDIRRFLSDGDLINLYYRSGAYGNKIFHRLDPCDQKCTKCTGFCINYDNRPKGHGFCLDLSRLLKIEIIKKASTINKIMEI